MIICGKLHLEERNETAFGLGPKMSVVIPGENLSKLSFFLQLNNTALVPIGRFPARQTTGPVFHGRVPPYAWHDPIKFPTKTSAAIPCGNLVCPSPPADSSPLYGFKMLTLLEPRSARNEPQNAINEWK